MRSSVNPNESSTEYDAAFGAISGLVWWPWVGRNYSQRPQHQRLLVVGESHYTKQSTPEALEEVRKRHEQGYPTYTRDVVSESLIRRDWTTPTLSNISKLLFQSTAIDAPRLWTDTVYCNIVQRLMEYSRKERPIWADFEKGWRVLVEIVRFLRPSHCLFLGVEAARSFDRVMTNNTISFVSVTRTQRVSRTWARQARLDLGGTCD